VTNEELMAIAQEMALPLPLVEELVQGSAIPPGVLKRAGISYVNDAKEASKAFGKTREEWDAGRLPAWTVPYRLFFQQDPVLVRAKPRKPFELRAKSSDGKIEIKLQKYAQAAKTGVHVYFGPSFFDTEAATDPKIPLAITEGEKKALSCEGAGVSCIALGGVNGWHVKGEKRLHPYFAHVQWDGRVVYLAFDADSLGNANVRREELTLGRVLEAAGATVYVVRFPQDTPKLDDYLAAHEVSEFHQLLELARQQGRLPPDVLGSQGAPVAATAQTDLGNAERFVRQHGAGLRYCEELGAWFVWNGIRWERDTTKTVWRRAMRTARSIYEEADSLSSEDERAKMRLHAKTTEARHKMAAMIELAGSMRSVMVRAADFDRDRWLLNCDNGVVDLLTGELKKHDPALMITKTTGTRFDPEAKHERWDAFLEQVTGGDGSIASYLQRAGGYSLTGDTSADRFFFLYGDGGHGKGTFVTAITAAMGEYARTASAKTFLENKNDTGGDKARPDLVRLLGARLVLCDEVKEGAKLDEETVKTITGGSPLSIRDLHATGFEMCPSFKLWLVANDPPRISPEDTGMWRRMVRVPFDHAPKEKDTSLRGLFKEDAGVRTAVLAWLVRGVKEWREHGLVEPSAVQASTTAYRQEMDPVGEFLTRHCTHDPATRTPRKDIRTAYERWCKEHGHTPQLGQRFAKRVRTQLRAWGIPNELHEVNARVTRWEVDEASGAREKVSTWQDAWRGIRLLTDSEKAARSNWNGASQATPVGEIGGVGEGNLHLSNLQTLTTAPQIAPNTAINPQYPQYPQKEDISNRKDSESVPQNRLGTFDELGTSEDPNTDPECGPDTDGQETGSEEAPQGPETLPNSPPQAPNSPEGQQTGGVWLF